MGCAVPIYSGVRAVDSLLSDSLKSVVGIDSLRAGDSLPSSERSATDSLRKDSLATDSLAQGKPLATDSLPGEPHKPLLDAPILVTFKDSLVYEPQSKDFLIYQQGEIEYEGKKLRADFMKLQIESKLVQARGVMDTTKKKMTRTEFVDGKMTYDMDSIAYNMDSGKAMIHGVNTKEGEGILFGGQVKKMKDNVVHMHNGRYTTCDAACPHFYLQMTKGTTVPGKNTVFGPAYMVFEDVPIYFLGLPFGFFPQKRERNSGFIFPEVGEEAAKGFFVRNGGYYFAINDYVDLSIKGGWYTLGSWEASLSSSYAKRYTFSGNFSFSYASDHIGEDGSPDAIRSSGMNIRWTHQQDPKFRPNSTFSASVNYMNNSAYNKYNSTNLQDYLSSQTSSSIAYSKNWPGKPFSLSFNASHSQNTVDSTISMSLPNFVFNVSRVAPFKRRKAIGKEKWYEKISFTYNMDFQNRVENVSEKYFMKQEMFDKLRLGFQHNLPVSASFNLFGALSITPNFTYTERWYFRSINQTWNQAAQAVVTDTTSGFYRVFNYGASLSLNTKLYGTYVVGRKKPTTIRHVFTPRIAASYSPDFGAFGYGFWKEVQTNSEGDKTVYSPFQNELYGVPGRGASGSLSFGIENTIEAKVPSDKDTSGYRKIKIIEAFSISSSYNFLAKEFQLAPFAVSLRFPIVKNYSVQLQGSFDAYAVENGRRINEFLVNRGGFLRLTSLSFSFGYGFKSKDSKRTQGAGRPAINNPTNNNNGQAFNETLGATSFFDQQNAAAQRSQIERARQAAAQYYDFSIPWSVNFNYSFNYSNPTGTSQITQSINANASVNLTDKWAISGSAGFDIQAGKLTPGSIQITRDLHCWQMSFTWVPVGLRQSWSFTIQAKSSMLSDLLKWKKDNSFWDNYYQ
ncbi:MAG: putative LPS assembly protein LptD [Mucinivorans sp.]